MHKTKFFFNCLRKGYNDDAFFESITKKDLLFRMNLYYSIMT
jgi:hypothetical protein